MSEQAPSMLELKSEIANVKVAVEEVRASQVKIAHALLGSFEKDGAGLLEQQRINVKDIYELKTLNSQIKEQLEAHKEQITELEKFKSEIKKVVAIIAFAIPLVFEILKGLAEIGYDVVRHKMGF